MQKKNDNNVESEKIDIIMKIVDWIVWSTWMTLMMRPERMKMIPTGRITIVAGNAMAFYNENERELLERERERELWFGGEK